MKKNLIFLLFFCIMNISFANLPKFNDDSWTTSGSSDWTEKIITANLFNDQEVVIFKPKYTSTSKSANPLPKITNINENNLIIGQYIYSFYVRGNTQKQYEFNILLKNNKSDNRVNDVREFNFNFIPTDDFEKYEFEFDITQEDLDNGAMRIQISSKQADFNKAEILYFVDPLLNKIEIINNDLEIRIKNLEKEIIFIKDILQKHKIVTSIELQSNKTQIIPNNEDEIIFTINLKDAWGNIIEKESTVHIYDNRVHIYGLSETGIEIIIQNDIFKSIDEGIFKFVAKYQDIISNEIEIIVSNEEIFDVENKPEFQIENVNNKNYQLLKAWNYEKEINQNKKYPLIIYLHGSSYSGNNSSFPLNSAFVNYLINNENMKKHPSFILVPQSQNRLWHGDPNQNITSDMQFVFDALNDTIYKYGNQIDDNRIYITGLSAGGIGIFDALYRSNVFAGALCFAGEPYLYYNNIPEQVYINITNTPLWIFAGEVDQTILYQNVLDTYNDIKDQYNILYNNVLEDSEIIKYTRNQEIFTLYINNQDRFKLTRLEGIGHSNIIANAILDSYIMEWLYKQRKD